MARLAEEGVAGKCVVTSMMTSSPADFFYYYFKIIVVPFVPGKRSGA